MSKVSIIITAFLLALIYLVYTGSYGTLEILIALLTGLGASLLFGQDLVRNPGKLSVTRFLRAVAYLVKYFTIVEAKAHWGVVKLILKPGAKYRPAIVRVPYQVSNEYSIVSIANSITNTPGTVVIDIDENRKVFYVHWIDAKALEDQEARRNVSEAFEKDISKIFE
uniref:Cation:proton antiporter n=1 Tax=Thermosphaera aggregans TaxID=54254 RepID=A0A7C2BLZ3_9CREN